MKINFEIILEDIENEIKKGRTLDAEYLAELKILKLSISSFYEMWFK